MAQFRRDTQQFQKNGNTIFEVVMLASNTGIPISTTNRLPVTLGTGTITITGNVNVGTVVSVNSTPGNPVHTHITEVGTSGILVTPYMPISGAVTITETLPELYSFSNFGTFSHRGWTMSDTLIPMLSVRAKSTATKTVRIINYDIGNNNANQSTVGYVWIEDAAITGSLPSWTTLNTQAEYRFYTDNYGSNTPNGFTGGTYRHSGIVIGKNSSAEDDIKDLSMTAGGITMTLCVMRLDSATKLDLWAAIDLGIFI